MRKALSDRQVAAMKPAAKRQVVVVPQLSNLYLRIQPSGAKSYWAMARNPSANQVWAHVGAADTMTIAQACERGRVMIQRIRDRLPAVEPRADAFGVVAAEWMKSHVRKKGLRTGDEYERILDRYIFPAWATREFVSIRRSDVAALLDRVDDRNGARQADYCLATIRAIANWYESRHDDYRSPVAKGMKRVCAKAAARDRILDDDEIRKVWAACGRVGTFGGMVQLALLTGQRQDKLAAMERTDVVDRVWTIRSEEREKGNGEMLTLPDLALAVIDVQPQLGESPYVFAGRGDNRPYSGFSKAKARLDKLSGVAGWRFHDLRRTSRSLMARAGVLSDHAEFVIGHARPLIESTYDRHAYFAEKKIALVKLAMLIDGIVNPRGGGNVLALEPSAQS
jgi:integrase